MTILFNKNSFVWKTLPLNSNRIRLSIMTHISIYHYQLYIDKIEDKHKKVYTFMTVIDWGNHSDTCDVGNRFKGLSFQCLSV